MHSPPHLQSSQRMRTNSSLSFHSVDSRGAVRKRSPSRSNSSFSPEHLHQLALHHQQSNNQCDRVQQQQHPSTSIAPTWLTPQHSPQHEQQVFSESTVEPFPPWSVPTPPRSDSGLPTVSIDSDEVAVTTAITSTEDFDFDHPTASAEMSSLGFLLPSQYGSGILEAEPSSYDMDQNYIPPMRMSQPTSTNGSMAYAQTISSSPALYQSRSVPSNPRRDSAHPSHASFDSYGQNYRRISSSYDSMSTGDYSLPPSQNIPSISGLAQSPQPSSAPGMMSSYHTSASRSPSLYDTSTTTPNIYNQQPPYHQPFTYPPLPPTTKDTTNNIRVLNPPRPKPQCWDHGCNGRQFSTFSNLLRHQREKSGTASKSYCPKCGAEFTRTTARNGHLAHDKCTGTGGSKGRVEE